MIYALLSIKYIKEKTFAEPGSTDRLKVYPTCDIDQMLRHRGIKLNKDTPLLENNKLGDIELNDNGLKIAPIKQTKPKQEE